jgi:hypothetical protein
MKIEKLEISGDVHANPKLEKAYSKLLVLIEALNDKVVTDENTIVINADIKLINSFSGSDKELRQVLKKKYANILEFVERSQKFVPKNYYRSRWIVFGMLAGIIFSTAIFRTEMAAMGTSISLGVIAGLLIGNMLDQQALKKGLQLNL